ncbi:PREDICTED: uncharacterized protein LOC109166008 [Ipomoea nil]|uniref:uncharacterized protein LOC109166008 n=1 Tax=Ipomoea nil TaxID=35883 RepID=UPI000900FE7E|nr:PREDICTED: uncharacterized protein LOC109166008 [Ipomoea nil]
MEVWNDLKRRFSQRDAQRISSVQNEIYGLKQGNLSVNDYYTRCRILWEELNTLRPLPVCKCIPRCACACDLVDEIRNERDVDQVIRFLQGLNEDFNSLKSNILVLDPLPEVYKVFVMAEKLERQINLASLNLDSLEINQVNAVQNSQGSVSENTIAAAVNNSNSNFNRRGNGGNKSAKCTFCGMTGHTVDRCYKKHGYPPGWVSGFKSKGKQQQFAVAATNNTGNMAIDSEQLQRIISLLQTQVGQSSSPNTTAAVSLIPKFSEVQSADEGKQSMPHINSILINSSCWILDSGATNHIVCSLDHLVSHRVAVRTEVSLPTGKCIPVENIGDVKLNDDLWLKGALHIPTFQFNIISVSKLLQDTPYKLIFMSDECVIQGIHGTVAGIARQEMGLYMLM